MALDASTSRTIVGVLGNIISFCLFLSPLPTFSKIIKEKSVLSFVPDPYVVTLFNCGMWVLYGMPFVHPDSLLVITINGIGLVIEGIYVTIFFLYADRNKRRKMTIILAVEGIIMLAVIIITLAFLHGTKSRSTFVGLLCIVLNIMMYVSPLTVMKRVIKTKSVKYMPFSLSVANLFNAIVWSTYALIKFDPFVLIPNGLGTISAVVQLMLYAAYYKTTNWDEDDNPSDIELQDPNSGN